MPPPSNGAGAPARPGEPGLVGLLALMLAFPPLSTDMVVAAFPDLAAHFRADAAHAQRTLSVFIGGFAVTQLLAGPLSDRFGRRPVVLGGVGAYVAGSVLAAVAPTLPMLLAGRLLQAVGACCTVVCARAIVRDRYEPAVGVRQLARATARMAIMPIVAPLAGGALADALGWRAQFWVMAAFGAVVLAACARTLRETHLRPDRDAMRPGPMLANYAQVLRSPTWLGFAAYCVAMYWAMFAFMHEAAFVLTGLFGLSATTLGVAVSAVASAFLLGSLASRRVLQRIGVRRTLTAASVLAAASGTTLAALALAPPSHALAVLVPQFVFVFAHGMSQPAWTVGAIAPFPRIAGTAAALTGFVQNAASAATGVVVGALHDGSLLPMAMMSATGGLAALVVSVTIVRRHGDAGLAPAAGPAPRR